MSRFRRGQRFRVREARNVAVLIHWRAPLTTAVTVTLPSETLLVIDSDPSPNADAFRTIPVDYERFEREVIPEGEWRTEGYDGYSIVIGDDEVADWLDLVE